MHQHDSWDLPYFADMSYPFLDHVPERRHLGSAVFFLYSPFIGIFSRLFLFSLLTIQPVNDASGATMVVMSTAQHS